MKEINVKDLIRETISKVCSGGRRKSTGELVRKELLCQDFMTARMIKKNYRKWYNCGIVSYINTHFSDEVHVCGFGGLKGKSFLIHKTTIEKAIEKFLKEEE